VPATRSGRGSTAPEAPAGRAGPGARWGRLVTAAAAVAAGAAVYALLPADLAVAVRAVAAWDAGVLVLLGRWWAGILRSDPARARRRAAADDPGRLAVLVIALVASAVSLAAATALLRQPAAFVSPEQDRLLLAVAVVAVAGAWVLTHTAFTLHYAHLYYRAARSSGGLTFDDGPPDDLDFAYFAFTIGMTYQTADVTVTQRALRRTVLGHGVLSFVYNTVILALAINVLFGRFK
jgi:uncharacterized membrane protein